MLFVFLGGVDSKASTAGGFFIPYRTINITLLTSNSWRGRSFLFCSRHQNVVVAIFVLWRLVQSMFAIGHIYALKVGYVRRATQQEQPAATAVAAAATEAVVLLLLLLLCCCWCVAPSSASPSKPNTLMLLLLLCSARNSFLLRH